MRTFKKRMHLLRWRELAHISHLEENMAWHLLAMKSPLTKVLNRSVTTLATQSKCLDIELMDFNQMVRRNAHLEQMNGCFLEGKRGAIKTRKKK